MAAAYVRVSLNNVRIRTHGGNRKHCREFFMQLSVTKISEWPIVFPDSGVVSVEFVLKPGRRSMMSFTRRWSRRWSRG